MHTQTRTFVSPFLLLLLLVLTACGGSSGGPNDPGGNTPPGDPPPDDSGVAVEIIFPASHVVTEGAATLIVRGRATDDVAVTAVKVNGVPAETDDGFAQWSARVPLEMGANRIEALAVDADGNEKTTDVQVQNAAFLPDSFIDVAWDEAGKRLFAVSGDGRIAELQTDSGEWRVLADTQHGSGVPFESVEKVLWDAKRDRLLALPHESNEDLQSIDVESGERTVQAGFFESSADDWQFDTLRDRLIVRYDVASQSPSLQAVHPVTGAHEMLINLAGSTLSGSFAYDAASNRAWFYERLARAVVEVILDSGDVLTISDDDLDNDPGTVDPRGEGDSLLQINDLALANDASTLLVLSDPNFVAPRLMHVDIASGDRSVFSESGVRGDGPAFVDSNGRLLTGETDDAIWVIDQATAGADGLVRVDPATGDRLPVRDEAHVAGAGPDLGAMGLRGSAFAPGRGELLFGGFATDNVVAVSVADGERRIVSDAETGDGPFLSSSLDVAFDAAAGNVWVSERSPTVLNKVNPQTGDREAISLEPENGTDAPSPFAFMFALHAVANRAYVIDRDLRRIYSADLTTGLFHVLSDPDPDKDPGTEDSIGAGDDLLVTGDALLDITNNRLILNGDDRVQAVDLGTGDRVTLLHTTGHPRLAEGGDAALMPNGTLAVPSRLESALLRVNPVTGERSEISDDDMDYEGAPAAQRGTGPAFLWPASAELVSTVPEILAVFDRDRNAVFLVDGETGDRVILSR